MITIRVSGRNCEATASSKVTSGSVGLPVRWLFDEVWTGLVKTAVFQGSGAARDVAMAGSECTVPAEVLKEAGGVLRIGVYGRRTDGTLVIPTVWAVIPTIYPGTYLSEVSPADPEPDWTAQVQAMAETALENAGTALDKATAVEEAADAGEFDGKSAYESAVDGGYAGTEDEFNHDIATVAGKYEKPDTGIPKTDLASDVQTSLGKADTALQEHQDISGKKNTQAAVSDPAADGTGLSFIDSISQNAQGVISPHKKTVKTDATPTASSANPVQSGGVKTALDGKKNTQAAVSDPAADGTGLSFIDSISQNAQGVISPHKKTVKTDATPTASSANPVQSGGVKTALDGKKNTQTAVSDPTADGEGLSFIDSISQNAQGVISPHKKTVKTDATPTAGSTNPVQSGGVKTALNSEATARGNADAALAERIDGIEAAFAAIGLTIVDGQLYIDPVTE